MNLNLSRLFSIAKVNYIALVCRCCVALALCGVLFFPSVEAYSATGGGGSTRGGGAGRVKYELPNMISLSPGYVVSNGSGDLTIRGNTDKSYVAFKRIESSDYTKTAEQKGVMTVVTELPQEYWLTFYNYNGSVSTYLGNTPKFTGYSVVEVPARTTYIVVHSVYSQSGTLILTAEVPIGQEMPVQEKASTFNKYDNVWRLGFQTAFGKPVIADTPFDPVTGTAYTALTEYFYEAYQGDKLKFSINSDYGYMTYGVMEYDFEYKRIPNQSYAQGVSPGYPTEYTIQGSNTKYIKITVDTYGLGKTTAERMKEVTTIEGLRLDKVYSSAYQVDNSSTHYITNNHQYSVNSYNIISGDNSPIVIVDGDGNTITLPGASPIVNTPPAPIPLPGETPPGGGSGDDDSGGGFFDIIGDLFGSIGGLLKGLMNIILTPIKLLVDTITEMIDTVTGTLSATSGMNEFFANLFGWLPSPIPGLLGMAIGSFIIIAIIKFLRG